MTAPAEILAATGEPARARFAVTAAELELLIDGLDHSENTDEAAARLSDRLGAYLMALRLAETRNRAAVRPVEPRT